jgi:hypothetical protein
MRCRAKIMHLGRFVKVGFGRWALRVPCFGFRVPGTEVPEVPGSAFDVRRFGFRDPVTELVEVTFHVLRSRFKV